MAKTKRYVVLFDVESIRVPYSTFSSALKELSKFGQVVSCKFYGYSTKRTRDYAEFIEKNSYEALSPLSGKKRGRLDMRQVIDAVELAQSPNIDGFFLICGAGDITPLIAYLKAFNLEVIAGVVEPDQNSVLCSKTIILQVEDI